MRFRSAAREVGAVDLSSESKFADSKAKFSWLYYLSCPMMCNESLNLQSNSTSRLFLSLIPTRSAFGHHYVSFTCFEGGTHQKVVPPDWQDIARMDHYANACLYHENPTIFNLIQYYALYLSLIPTRSAFGHHYVSFTCF